MHRSVHLLHHRLEASAAASGSSPRAPRGSPCHDRLLRRNSARHVQARRARSAAGRPRSALARELHGIHREADRSVQPTCTANERKRIGFQNELDASGAVPNTTPGLRWRANGSDTGQSTLSCAKRRGGRSADSLGSPFGDPSIRSSPQMSLRAAPGAWRMRDSTNG